MVMNIAFAFDGCIADHVPVLIRSIKDNNRKHEICFHIVADGCRRRQIQRIKQECGGMGGKSTARFYDPSRYLKIIPDLKNGSGKILGKSTFIRLFLPEIIQKTGETNKLLYLDVDCVAVDDLSPLFETDMQDKVIAGVSEAKVFDADNYNRLDILFEDWMKGIYFNAGVLLFQTDNWKKMGCGARIRKCIENFDEKKYIYVDQDILNEIFSKEVWLLPRRYNCIKHFFMKVGKTFLIRDDIPGIEKEISDPCIIHFSTLVKPWHKETRHPYSKVWRYYAKQIYPEFKPKRAEKSLMKRMKKTIRKILSTMKLAYPIDDLLEDDYINKHYERAEEILERIRATKG